MLPPGGEMEIDVAFQPMGADAQSAVAIVSSNADLQPTVPVNLTGEGLVAELAITPDPLDFGQIGLGCDAVENVTLENVGSESLTISAITADEDAFALTTLPTLPTELAPVSYTHLTLPTKRIV